MAKKPPTPPPPPDPPKKRAPTGKQAPAAAPARKKAGAADYNAPVPDTIKAAAWVHAETGLSQREIARMLSLAPSTVGKILYEDPLRLEALRARLAEEYAARYRQLETGALDGILGWLKHLEEFRTGRKRIGDRTALKFGKLPGILNALRQAAETGGKMHALLTGGVTERIGHASSPSEMSSVDEIIEEAIRLDSVERLPPRLREMATRELARRGMETPPANPPPSGNPDRPDAGTIRA